jgi:hypothetical protein
VAEYAPRAIKLAVTGRGGAAKEQVAAMVQLQLRLAERPQADAADALAARSVHLRRAKFDAPRRRTPGGRAPRRDAGHVTERSLTRAGGRCTRGRARPERDPAACGRFNPSVPVMVSRRDSRGRGSRHDTSE